LKIGYLRIRVLQFLAAIRQPHHVKLGFIPLGLQLLDVHIDTLEVTLGCDVDLATHFLIEADGHILYTLVYLGEHTGKRVLQIVSTILSLLLVFL
jgi:hypothetical protein